MAALFNKNQLLLFQNYSYGIGDVKEDEHKVEVVEIRIGSYRSNNHNMTYYCLYRHPHDGQIVLVSASFSTGQ